MIPAPPLPVSDRWLATAVINAIALSIALTTYFVLGGPKHLYTLIFVAVRSGVALYFLGLPAATLLTVLATIAGVLTLLLLYIIDAPRFVNYLMLAACCYLAVAMYVLQRRYLLREFHKWN